ncbi:phytanoyl-CoA dioxygenase family protein [Brevundimonas sp.]|uniref:phytanoyl-CoA dioxygenase family protein n=1 Tax=Brevundimonas sp. TaxID=1871086 RepID=UPI002488E2D3|nr:phytanoyl-CoA dioxygenase family protein [Brevundimonas sp.]MDI1280368.1 phytanoyl-CoA dioxygenase family protein [Brevundimonas sp.]
MWKDRPIFKDAELQAEVWSNGFAVRRLVSTADAASILEDVHRIRDQLDIDFDVNGPNALSAHLTNFHPNEGYRRAVAQLTQDRLQPHVEKMLCDYRVMASTLFMKPPGQGELKLHADHTLQEDFEWPTITAWCALTETTLENGALEFVPGTHALFETFRGFEPPFLAALSELGRMTLPVPIRAGEAIFFDSSALHRSGRNTTDHWRSALIMACLPSEKVGAHTYIDPDEPDRLQYMLMDRDERIAYREADVWAGKIKTRLIRSGPLPGPGLAVGEVLAVVKNADKIRSGEKSMKDIVSEASGAASSSREAAYARKAYFKDPKLQAQFVEKGYVRHRLLSREAAGRFLSKVSAFGPDDNFSPEDGRIQQVSYHMTELDSNVAYKNEVWRESIAEFGAIVDELLVDYRIQNATLFVKPPGRGAIPPHTDWTIQEDNSWPTIYVWCPLVDVTEKNGPLQVIPGSHSVLDILHGPRIIPAYSSGMAALSDQMQSLPADAGEAVIFDSSILHGSLDNLTDQPRFAIRLACVPKTRRGVLHCGSEHNPNVIETYSMEADELFGHDGVELVSGRLKSEMIRRTAQPELKLSPEELVELISQGDRIRNGETSMEAVIADVRSRATPSEAWREDEGAPPARGSLLRRAARKARRILGKVRRHLLMVVPTNSQPALPASPQALANGPDFSIYPPREGAWTPFDSEAIDRPLQDRGFATFPFLPVEKIDQLARVIEAAETTLDRGDVHIETRFQLSAFSNDGDYKERLFDAIWEYLEDAVTALLPEYEPLVINVFDKRPSDACDSVPIHQNPSFVDEPRYKSVSLWIPLGDTSKQNGTVGVLPGSHNRFNRMRAGNMAHEDVFAEVQHKLEHELIVPVDLKKGEILALDDSIIHWSYPNVSDTRRTAVQLIMVPRGVPHIYYYYDEDSPDGPMMDLYAVDHRFFFGFNCKAKPQTLEHIGRVPYRYRAITEAELLQGTHGA